MGATALNADVHDHGSLDGVGSTDLVETFNHLRAAYLREPFPSWEVRRAHLKTLRALILNNRDELADAISADFGSRSRQEIELSEIFLLKEEIDSALKHGAGWMRAQRRAVNKWLLPARALVMPQPLGVIGIVAPWNYPVQLALGPLICALTAGNRALIKTSELTPRTSRLLEQLVAENFDHDHVRVINGDASVGAAFTSLPFDHLLFTGSTKVGYQVMRAAAENLTPVTLELGGKAPAIIGPNARFDYAVDSLLIGKTLNAGQTCVAPDYVLVPRGREHEFIERARQAFGRMYPDLQRNRDYTSIVSPRHFSRLQQLASGAQAQGATLHPLSETSADVERRRFTLTVVTGAPDDSALMQEEIFGPLLPLVPYDTLDQAIEYINARPRPLALYLYEQNRPAIERVLRETIAGGVAINDSLVHLACEDLPFGGVGASGMGAYHGYEGFRTFSLMKPVFRQTRFNARNWLSPPYGRRFAALMKVMLKF
ncbi:coniferyl aldehyde dehydrogenase [Paraburkholderia sediminicola]|uniref:coniferyl aldehyde dehydrogenase n=1 Tax=Paraburkholderia sediminicola TaxID=458836 RepID=UPI0038BCCD08